MKIAQVFVEHPIMHLDHTFTYACDGFSLQRGVRVSVPFGKTSIVGFVMRWKPSVNSRLRNMALPYALFTR